MIINGKKYVLPELSFNTMCRLEEMGASLSEIGQKPMAAIRAFTALAVGTPEKAGEELEKHLTDGGDLKEIVDEITRAVNESGFFQALSKKRNAPKKEKPAELK